MGLDYKMHINNIIRVLEGIGLYDPKIITGNIISCENENDEIKTISVVPNTENLNINNSTDYIAVVIDNNDKFEYKIIDVKLIGKKRKEPIKIVWGINKENN